MKKDLSRRQFLHRTAGAAGALAASPAIFLEPEHIPLPLQTVAPSDRLRFGIIGKSPGTKSPPRAFTRNFSLTKKLIVLSPPSPIIGTAKLSLTP